MWSLVPHRRISTKICLSLHLIALSLIHLFIIYSYDLVLYCMCAYQNILFFATTFHEMRFRPKGILFVCLFLYVCMFLCVAMVVLELPLQTRLAWTQNSASVFQFVRIKGMCCHHQVAKNVLFNVLHLFTGGRGVGTHAKSENNLWGLFLSFYDGRSGDWTQVITLGNKCL